MSDVIYYSEPQIVWQPPTAPAAREPLAASAPLAPNVLWAPAHTPAVETMAFVPDAPAESMDTGTDGGRTGAIAASIGAVEGNDRSFVPADVPIEAASCLASLEKCDQQVEIPREAVAQTGAAIRRYRCVLSDPPWKYDNRTPRGMKKNAAMHYPCLSVDQIAALPVADVLTDDAVLFLWVTGPFIVQAAKIATAWGFPEYSGLAFTWAKQSTSGKKWHFGPGYWTRHNAELVLLFTRKKMKAPRRDRGVPELVVAPRREHSRKPDEVHERIERLVDGPRLELFAREERTGWRTLGNHLTGNDIADDLRAIASQPSLDFAALDAAPADPQQQPDRTLEDRHE